MCHKCEDFLFLVPWTLAAAHSRHAVDFVKWKNISCPICIYKLFVKSFLTLTWIIWNLKKIFCPRILNLALFIESSLIQMHLPCILCARHGTAMACSVEPALPSTQVDPVLTKHSRCLSSFQCVWVTWGECMVWVQASPTAQQYRICLRYRRWKRWGFKPWGGKIPWRRKCKPLQYSCLENPMDRRAWRATVQR